MLQEIKTPLEETDFFSAIKNRLNKENRNWLCAITGDTGSGKSYTALRIGEILDPGFSISSVAFDPKEFITLVKNGKKGDNGGFIPLTKGSIIIFDEAGVGMAAREWQSIQNKLMGYILQTFRFKNYGVIFTVPDLSFIDVQARKLFHNYIKTREIDYSCQRVKCSIYVIDHNDWINKTYRHTVGSEGQAAIWGFPKPSEVLISDYERKKAQYAEGLYQSALDMIDGRSTKESRMSAFCRRYRAGEDPFKVAEELDLAPPTAAKYIRDTDQLYRMGGRKITTI